MKRRYKMLPLSFPFTHELTFWANCVGDETTPRFGRNGKYLDRKTKEVWIEVNGKAWLYGGVETFLHDLAHTGVRRLEDHGYKALSTLVFMAARGLDTPLPRDLFQVWAVENHLRQRDRTRRDARLTMRKFMNSI